MVNHILKDFFANNAEFVKTHGEYYVSIRDKQSPDTTLLKCCDSRFPVAAVKKDTLNKVFYIKNIGNQIKTAEGSIDYGILHLHTPLFLIVGHTNCGAVKACSSNYSEETKGIKKELDTLKKGLDKMKKKYDDNDIEKLNKFSELNVDFQIKYAMKKYKSLVKEGKLTIVGMIFDFNDSYSSEKGALFITNINGQTNVEKLKKSYFLEGIIEDIGSKVKRIS